MRKKAYYNIDEVSAILSESIKKNAWDLAKELKNK